jgi:hypothetical protein
MLKRSSSHALGVTLIPTQSSSLTTFIPTSAFDSAVFDHAIGVTQTEGSPSAVSSGPDCSSQADFGIRITLYPSPRRLKVMLIRPSRAVPAINMTLMALISGVIENLRRE